MLRKRVIPCLLLKDGGFVKTKQFSNPRYVGDPINTIRIFNDKEVDEIMVIDIMASREGREPDYKRIGELARECFMPLCYAGGIKNPEQAERIFALGVEKICIQSAALENPMLISRISEINGIQSVVCSIDIKRNWLGYPGIYNSLTGKPVSESWIDYLQQVVAAGAGEILLHSVDRDGMMQGMDLSLIREAVSHITVPLIALGGVGSLQHIKEAADAGASAVAAGSFFVFHGPHRAVLITYPEYGEMERLLGRNRS